MNQELEKLMNEKAQETFPQKETWSLDMKFVPFTLTWRVVLIVSWFAAFG